MSRTIHLLFCCVLAPLALWDAQHGMRPLSSVLTSELGADLTGQQLNSAWAISDDGRTIVGGGINPEDNTEAWRVTIPSPPITIVAVVMSLLSGRRRRL